MLYFGGKIFVVDSTSSDEDMELAAAELQSALLHTALRDLPLLVLANKQDKKEARTVEKVIAFNILNFKL